MRLLKAACVILCFIFVTVPSWAQEVVELKFSWLDQFQFAGYYMAREKGFYRQEDLIVRFVPFTQGAQDVVKTVLTGEGKYGTGRSSLIARRIQGEKVVALAAIFQDPPSVLLARDDTGITELSDLIGRRVMITDDELASASIMGMLASAGIRPFDFIRQKHSYNLDDLINRKTDAMASYISNEPFRLKEQGIGYVAFYPLDFDQNYYGDLLFTSQAEMTSHPKRTVAFVRASLRGWNYAFDHIEETAELIWSKYNSQEKSLESLIFEGNELKKLAFKDRLPLGHMSKKKWQEIARQYYDMGVFPENYDFGEFIWTGSLSGPQQALLSE